MARTNLGKIVMIPKGTYSTTVTYSKLDVVTSNGSGYISKSDNNLNKPLTNETYWMKLVEKGDKGDKGDSYIITEDDIQEIKDYVVGKTSGQIIATRNELERVKNDVLETGTDTDTFIHLEDSAMAEYQELNVDGVCEQETTTGKNIWNLNSTYKTETGSEYVLRDTNVNFPSGEYNLSLNCSSNSKVLFSFKNSEEKKQDVYLEGTYNGTITFTDDIVKVAIYIYGSNATTISNIMLRLSTTDNTYEPYTGGQPTPRPDFPQPISVIENSLKITSCNKNLCKLENLKLITNSNGEVVSNNNCLNIILNGYKFNEYYISGDYSLVGDSSIRVGLYNEYPTIGIVGKRAENLTNEKQILNTEGYKYVLLSFLVIDPLATEKIKKSFQIEIGNKQTSFIEHLETQIEANLPEGEFIGKINDTYKDTLKVEYNEEDGQYHLNLYKNIGKVVLDGSDDEIYSFNSGTTQFYMTRANFEKLGLSPKNNSNVISNYFRGSSAWALNCVSFSSSGALQIWIDDNNITSTALFEAWLSTHPTKVYYALAEPYVLDLGVVDMPITYNEITNLFTDSDLLPTINAKYYRNFISTVRNLQVNEKALKQELIDINNRLSALESASANIVSESEVIE